MALLRPDKCKQVCDFPASALSWTLFHIELSVMVYLLNGFKDYSQAFQTGTLGVQWMLQPIKLFLNIR